MKQPRGYTPPAFPGQPRPWALVRINKLKFIRSLQRELLWVPLEFIENETFADAWKRIEAVTFVEKIVDAIVLPGDENPNFPNGAWDHRTARPNPFPPSGESP